MGLHSYGNSAAASFHCCVRSFCSLYSSIRLEYSRIPLRSVHCQIIAITAEWVRMTNVKHLEHSAITISCHKTSGWQNISHKYRLANWASRIYILIHSQGGMYWWWLTLLENKVSGGKYWLQAWKRFNWKQILISSYPFLFVLVLLTGAIKLIICIQLIPDFGVCRTFGSNSIDRTYV